MGMLLQRFITGVVRSAFISSSLEYLCEEAFPCIRHETGGGYLID